MVNFQNKLSLELKIIYGRLNFVENLKKTYSYNSSIQSSFKFYDNDLRNGHVSGNCAIYRTKSSPISTPRKNNLVVNGSNNE
uniref:Uncharacterized protein n=1 Tax=Romanomermis culicivorax TaxID=13658 RepID=A0A915IGG1_ROMCU